MKSIHIKDSYKIWKPRTMMEYIQLMCFRKYDSPFANEVLHRSYVSICTEWWLHNIGYYLTKPFCRIPFVMSINMRCTDVDLEEH